MPYVEGFTNDIFISFAHANNWDGWVEKFQDALSHRLVEIGAEVTIWRDKKLRGTDVFSDEIFTQLQSSALLISIISPPGIKSRWCEDERQAFERFAALNGGLRFANTLRAINVVKTPLPGDQHHQLFGTTGYEFYEWDKQADRFDEFDQSSPEFRRIFNNLAQDIKDALDNFSAYLKSTPRKDTVYVATTTPNLKPSREAIVQQLEDWGYAVVPQDFDPPRRSASFQAVTKAELGASLFSVHVANDEPQPIVEDQQDSITKQYELAQSLRKDRIVWVEPGRQLYSQFDAAIKQGLQNGVEILINRNIEYLKEVIGDKLKEKENQPVPPPKRETKPELYLICDNTTDHPSLENSDSSRRALLIQEFLGQTDLIVVPSPFTQMEWSELEDEYKAQLQSSNGVLLYWGDAKESWFLKLRRLIASEQTRRNKTSDAGPLTEAFYFSSPRLKKSQYRKLAEFVFEQYEGFDPNALKPLLDRLLANEET